MKTILKEIQTYIIIGIIAIIAVSILFVRLKKTQNAVNFNLIELVPSSTTALLRVNKPNDMRKYVLSNKDITAAFNSQIPPVFVSLINFIRGNQTCLCSFHPQGIIFYAQIDNYQEKSIKENILQPYFGSFAPQIQNIANINVKFYAAKDNQFLGYYLKNGIFICSYSRKLLEETIFSTSAETNTELIKTMNEADNKAPFNVFINSDLLNLRINLSDSTMWKLKSRWLSADFFMNKNKLCYFGSLPYFTEIDSLYTPLADTLTLRIKTAFPKFNFSAEINKDTDKMLYTGRLE